MNQRRASVERKTDETQIEVALNLEGHGSCECSLSVGFVEHMLDLLCRHARIDLTIQAQGDLHVDDHHLVEDLGITIGQVLDQALGDRRGITRYGFALLPMDEVLVAVAMDLGGRFAFGCDYRPQRETIGDLSTELIPHFFSSLALQARMNLHFHFLSPGWNEHHRVEAMFKGFARSLRMAVAVDPQAEQEIPSTKGVL